MRVLFVNENLGGHATLHQHLRRSLTHRSTVDAVFLDVPKPRLARRLVAAPVPGLSRLDADFQPLRYQLAQSYWVKRRLSRLAPGFDALHVYTQNSVLLSQATLRSHPSVIATDSTNELNAYTLPYRSPGRFTPTVVRATRRFEDEVLGAATMLAPASEYAAASLRDHYGIPDDRIEIIRPGIRLGEPGRREPTSVPEITFVGWSMARKGGHLLLDVHQRHLRDTCILNLVTPEPVPELPNVRTHTDVRPDDGQLDAILRRTAVFVFPSEIDKSSNAVLEAMAAAVPVVAFDAGAAAEMIGETGRVVPTGDVDALAAAIIDLVSDRDTFERLGRDARARVERLFSVDAMVDQILRLLDRSVRLHRSS